MKSIERYYQIFYYDESQNEVPIEVFRSAENAIEFVRQRKHQGDSKSYYLQKYVRIISTGPMTTPLL